MNECISFYLSLLFPTFKESQLHDILSRIKVISQPLKYNYYVYWFIFGLILDVLSIKSKPFAVFTNWSLGWAFIYVYI